MNAYTMTVLSSFSFCCGFCTLLTPASGSPVMHGIHARQATVATSNLCFGPGIADSIEIVRARFLLSGVRLRAEGNDSLHDCQLKSGPFIMEFTPGYSNIFSMADIPSGLYEKIQFGICKFPSLADSRKLQPAASTQYSTGKAPQAGHPDAAMKPTYILRDPEFLDFMTEEQVTIIIEGKVWSAKNPEGTNFIYKSHCTADLEVRFPGLISIDKGSSPKIALVFRPSLVFNAALLLDPRDPENANDIDNSLKQALTAVRK